MTKFFEAVSNVFRVPDLRNRILFLLGMLAVYRFGQHVPTPGVDALRFEEFVRQNAGSFLGFIDTTRLQDLNVELLWRPFDLGDWNWIGQIRPHLGATVNFGGYESQVYAGLSWTHFIAGGPVFIEGSLGGTIHNGALSGVAYPARNLGCSVLFRESASLGYQFSEQGSVMLTVDHSSHAGLCGPTNMGLTNLGVRVGWKF